MATITARAFTTNFTMPKPAYIDEAGNWGKDINDNLDTIDTQLNNAIRNASAIGVPVLGDTIYGATSAWTRLAGNITATKQFWSSTGAGAISAVPVLAALIAADMPSPLDDLGALAVTDGNFIVGDGATWIVESGATVRTSLGLGTIATQASDNVTISGGTISGITDLTIADGGTGASTAAAALTALMAAQGILDVTADARTNSIDTAVIIRSLSTGIEVAGIGTGLQFDASTPDESPFPMGMLGFVATDVTDTSEDTEFVIHLRVAGDALEEKYNFRSTAATGFTAIFTHANSADRTYTLPDSDATLGATPNALLNTQGDQGINNLDAANEELQRAHVLDSTTGGADTALYVVDAAVTFGEAYAATPAVVVGGMDSTTHGVLGVRDATTTGFGMNVISSGATTSHTNQAWIALGD